MQELLVAAGRQVVVERDRVDVAGDDHALVPAEVGARDDGVAPTGDDEVVDAREGLLHLVGDLLLVEAHREDVDQLFGQRDGVGGEVERHAAILSGHPDAQLLDDAGPAQDSRREAGGARKGGAR